MIAAVWAVGCFCFFQWCYPYHFFYKEQNQLFLWSTDYVASYFPQSGWLANLAGDFLTQFYYYLFAGATILTIVLLLLMWMAYGTLRTMGVGRWWAFAVALLVATLEAIFHLRYDFKLSATISVMGWIGCITGTVLMIRFLKKMVSRRTVPMFIRTVPIILPLILVAWWLFGIPAMGKLTMPNWYLERQLRVDSEYYFGNWDRVVTLVEQDEERTPEMLFFYNLVMAQRGQLPDVLLKYRPNTLGTFYRIGPDTPMLTLKNMNELYWALGDMTFTERAAMMANVFSPENRNSRMVRRLAECALVSGDSVAARKFLGLLEQTFVWRGWARNAPSAVYYAEKARYNNQQDTITTSDNAHFIMMQLLDSNPDNEVALDYILCSTLLLKDIENFKRDYDRYCTERPRLKKLYQEALCIWLAGSNAPEEEWHRYVKQHDVVQRFVQYNQQRGSAAYSDTYWYYFDKVKAPKI
jgi:hypothetical protein